MIALATHRRSTSPQPFASNSTDFLTTITGQFAALALDYIETGVFVVDGEARVQFVSAAARRLVDAGRLCIRNGSLTSSVGSESTALRRAIKQAVEGSATGASPMTFQRLGDADDVLCLGIVAIRGPGDTTTRAPFVMLFATRPCEASLPDTRQLRSHFGLTDAQAKLAIEIAKGEGLKVCARRLGIAVSTGRSHLKQIFEKTETRRQAELVRVISACRFNVPEANGAGQLG